MNNSTIAHLLSRLIRLSAAAALLALLTGLLPFTQPVRADTYVVTETDDDVSGSLRWAISEANSNDGPDTITFHSDTDGIPIVLTGLAAENANASGDLDILDNGDLTIQGNGEGNTIIDGDGNDRVFHVCPGGGCNNTVTFIGMTIQNGKVTLSGGGGIRNQGGTTIVDSSTIRDNFAINGGGIANFATLTIQNSTIGGTGAGNQAWTGSGGGIYNYAGTVTVDHTVVSDNTADKNGGGIWSKVTLKVQNGSTVSANTAVLGGGIYNSAGTTTVTGSTVSAGTADYGGGIYNYYGTLIVQNDSIIGGAGAGNKANFHGGGIYSKNGDTTVHDSTVSANTANSHGGGINSYQATLNIQNSSTVSANKADTGAGGGISTGSGSTTMVKDSTISANTANTGGGGISTGFDSTTTVDSSTVRANTAERGGGISNGGTLTVQNGSIIGGAGAENTADEGGGIYNSSLGTTTVAGSTVSGNTVSYLGTGGGIHNEGSLNVQNGSTVSGNTTASFGIGGGIYNHDGDTTVDGSMVSANTAGYGGGIWNEGGTLTVQNGSTIGGDGAGNTSDHYGGGIVNTLGTTTVTGSRILNNTAATNGGGVYNFRDVVGATSVTGSCIVGNSANSYYNKPSAEQIATGNWWGAATGPNTLGADTVAGIVDVSNYWTIPILGCAPDLQVSKNNDTGGKGKIGTPFHWRLTVKNTGFLNASFKPGETILVDELPAGPTYGTPVTGSFVDVPKGANIGCSLAGNTLICAAAGGDVTLGPLTGSFEVTFSVMPRAPGTLVNPEGICKVDPEGNVAWDDESNNNCPPNVVNVVVSTSYLYLPVLLK